MGRKTIFINLSRRERQMMDVIYQLGKATANDVMERIPDPPGNASVRKLLRILEEKGFLRHKRRANQYVYSPIIPAERAKASAMENLLDTFFSGSAASAAIALLNMSDTTLSDEEREMLADLIEKSKKEGR